MYMYVCSSKHCIGRAVTSFWSPVALFSTPVAKCATLWVNSINNVGNLTRSVKGKSVILSCNRCYRLQPLMTALH